jgi:hypothetical protein
MNEYQLLISADHRQRAKYIAAVGAVTDSIDDIMSEYSGIGTILDIDNAIGDQLDIIGNIVGLLRYQLITGLGVVNMDDTDYRFALRAKILNNSWDGTTDGMDTILATLSSVVQIRVIDHQDMSISIFIFGGVLNPVINGLMQDQKIIPKPMGVRLRGVYTISNPLFGVGINTTVISGPGIGHFV